MRSAANEGAVVLMLSTDAGELAGVADRAVVFSRGHVIEEIHGDDLTERAITSAALSSVRERGRKDSTRRRVINWLASDQAPVAIVSALVLALVIVGALADSKFLGPYNVSGILTLSSVLACVAFGQLLVLLTGGIDLSVGPVVGLVVNIASFFLVDGDPATTHLMGWVLMFGAALLVGLVNWLLIDFVKLSPLIAALVTYMAVQGVSFVLRPSPGGSIGSTFTDPVTTLFGPIPLMFIIVVIIAVVLGLGLKHSKPGIVIRAVGSREEAARVNGLNPRRVRLLAYLGSSFFAALAGIMFMAQTATGDAAGGVNFTLLSITAAVMGGARVFGGRGSFIGALLGAIIVQVVAALTVFLGLTPDWQYYLVGLMTLGAVSVYSMARQSAAARH